MLLATLVAAAALPSSRSDGSARLGALAAIGATEKHLRLVLLTNGAVVGAIGAWIGAIVGLAIWLALVPTRLEPALGHRIDRVSLPSTLLLAIVCVAVLGATAAACGRGEWSPASPSRRARRDHRGRGPHTTSTMVAAVLIAAGIGSVALSNRGQRAADRRRDLRDDRRHPAPGPAGDSPSSRAAGHALLAPRLALRDSARYQARSGAALAAITLALGIAAAVVIVAAAEEKQSAAEPANLSNRQIRVYTGATLRPEIVAVQPRAELERQATRVRQLGGRARRCDRDPAPNHPPGG